MKKQLSFPELKQLIARKERLIEKHKGELSTAKQVLRAMCQHENTRVEERYVAGDYYNRAYTECILVCEECGTIVGRKTEQHAHYG